MKKSLFRPRLLLKILFSHQKLSKICLMVGFGLFVGTIIFYVLGLTTIFSMIKFPENSFHYDYLLRIMLIFFMLGMVIGAHASVWLILAFTDQKRLIIKRRNLKIICLCSGNLVAYYTIDYLIEDYWDREETISAVLLTNEHVLSKHNQILQAFFIVFSMFSLVSFPPMFVLTCWVLAEARYVYLEESDVRDRIGLTLAALFCLFPAFSWTNLIVSSRNGLFVSWLAEIMESDGVLKPKNNWSRGLNILIWIVYWLAIVSLLIWLGSMLTFIFVDFLKLNLTNYLILFIWPISTFFFLFFSIYKKFLYELDQKVSLWILVFEILTLNLLMMLISLIFIYKNYHDQKNESCQWKTELDRNFFWLISVNTVLTYLLIIEATSIAWIGVGFTFGICIIAVAISLLLDLVLNISKMTNYKTYLANLGWWFAIDLLSFNIIGLINDIISWTKKRELVQKMVWIP